MSSFLIKIDEELCNSCGLCIKDCISGCLLEKDSKPFAVNPGWCSLCSHCVAICPKGAIDHNGLTGLSPKPIGKDKLDPEMYRKIVTTRRSIRRFNEKDVPRKEIEDILYLAAYSPTASNTRDVGYTVITNRRLIRNTGLSIFKKFERIMKILKSPPGNVIVSLLDQFAPKKSIRRYLDRYDLFTSWVNKGRDVITHDAPALIIIHGPKKSRFARDNSAIAADNITNYAHAKGLGTCYIGLVNIALDLNRKLSSKLGVPKDRKVNLVLALGYPAYKYQNTPIRPEPSINWIDS